MIILMKIRCLKVFSLKYNGGRDCGSPLQLEVEPTIEIKERKEENWCFEISFSMSLEKQFFLV